MQVALPAVECVAVIALAHVPARARVHAHTAIRGFGELEHDLRAGRVAGEFEVNETGAGAQQQRLDCRHRDAERHRQLLVAEALQLAHKKRGALWRRQRANIGDKSRHGLAALGDEGGVLRST